MEYECKTGFLVTSSVSLKDEVKSFAGEKQKNSFDVKAFFCGQEMPSFFNAKLFNGRSLFSATHPEQQNLRIKMRRTK
jgi:hypothetical protein